MAAPAILSFFIRVDVYSLKKQQYFMGMLNEIANISVAVAPVIGSHLTLYFDWYGNFAALLILAVLALGMTLVYIPHHN